MKTKLFFSALISISMVLIISLPSCEKTKEEPEKNMVEILSTFDITENSFVVNWSTNTNDIKTISIKLAIDESFAQILAIIPVDDTGSTSHLVEGLNGATPYYIKVMVTLNSGGTLESNIKRTVTAYQDENVSIITGDGLTLTGRIKYLNSNTGKNPAIIFMQHYKSLGNQWNGSDLERKCVAEGWVCLVLNFRGHSGSDPWPLPDFPSLEELIEIQVVLGADVTATIDFLKSNPKVDPAKLALLGGSLGANMALEGNCQVLTSIGFTCSLVKPDALCAGTPLKSVFYIVGEFDEAGGGLVDFYKDTKILHGNTQEPKKLLVIGSQDHGWDLLTPSIEDQVVEWLDTRFME